LYASSFAPITNRIRRIITQWQKLIGLLLMFYLYQVAYNWSLIKQGDVEFATFPANGKPGHSPLTNNGMGFAINPE
jgi:hypothetical protein